LLDRLAPAFGAFVLLGRLGCFVAGCDFGRPTSQGFAVQYPSAAAAHFHHVHSGFIEAGAPMSLPVHPVQLYEALVGALMFALALLLGTRRTPLGLRFSCVACAYAAGRFFTDLLRADLPPLSVIPSVSFTQSQCISLIVLGSAAAVWTGRACDFSATLVALEVAPFGKPLPANHVIRGPRRFEGVPHAVYVPSAILARACRGGAEGSGRG
jgi:phosphatidylglycerol:prolipoprotein diacylglycerol transferase